MEMESSENMKINRQEDNTKCKQRRQELSNKYLQRHAGLTVSHRPNHGSTLYMYTKSHPHFDFPLLAGCCYLPFGKTLCLGVLKMAMGLVAGLANAT